MSEISAANAVGAAYDTTHEVDEMYITCSTNTIWSLLCIPNLVSLATTFSIVSKKKHSGALEWHKTLYTNDCSIRRNILGSVAYRFMARAWRSLEFDT